MRLFTAIDFPDDLREEICGFRRNLPGVRWTQKEQIHLTLRFIGEADEEHFEMIKRRLAEVEFPAFDIQVDGTGFFPNERRPRVFWIGCAENETLSRLKNKIDEKLIDADLPLDDREKYVPHITLARLKFPDAKTVDKLKSSMQVFKPAKFAADRFYLYSSVLTSDGSIHTREMEIMARQQ